MRAYFTCATLGFALVAGAPPANAQSQITLPYENFGAPPSGTLPGPMPMVAVSAGVLKPTQIVQPVQTAPAVRPAVRHQAVANHRTTAHRVAAAASSRPLYNCFVATRSRYQTELSFRRAIELVVLPSVPPHGR